MVERSPFNSLVGATLGNYVLEEILEQSEAGPVFKARNTAAGALFRLRVLVVPPNLKPEDRIVYLGRFQKEANKVASLQHMYILPLVDYAMHSAVGDPQGNILALPGITLPPYETTKHSTCTKRANRCHACQSLPGSNCCCA